MGSASETILSIEADGVRKTPAFSPQAEFGIYE